MASSEAIVVATIAFGMGVDKANIRYCVPLQPAQEPGELLPGDRPRRDATANPPPATCWCARTTSMCWRISSTATHPDPGAVQGLIRDIFSQKSEFDVSLYSLSAEHDIRPLVLRTLLTYLELRGFLAGGTPFYSRIQIQAADGLQERYSPASRVRAGLSRRTVPPGAQGPHLAPHRPGAPRLALGTDRERVIRALDWLGEQQLLAVEASGVRHRYRRLKSPGEPAALAEELHRYYEKREAAEIARLRQVLDLAGHKGCQTAALAAHFGEQLDGPCGHCTWCLSGGCEIPERHSPGIPSRLQNQIDQAVAEAKGALDEPGSLARFLCGVPSPRLARAKLGKHPLSGSLSLVPFREVLDWVHAHRRSLADQSQMKAAGS